MKRYRVLLADDHPLTLEGIRSFLEPHFESVRTVADGRALVQEALRQKPDLIILDVTMPLLNGIDAAIQIRKSMPSAKMLFVTMHADPAYLEAALNVGAKGYVVKTAAREQLLDAATSVLSGGIYITPGLAGPNLECVGDDPRRAAASMRLSDRERETLQLIAEGRAAKAIASIMGISVKTVAFHRENIKRKLGLRTTAELTRHALAQGMI